MSAWQSILHDLRLARARGEWVCGSFFYSTFRPTFAQRISLDLRPRGYVIESEPCRDHHHASTIHRYRLIREPDPEQRELIAS